jgi:hypothetical protein
VGDEQGKLEKGGARKDGCAEDGVVCEPGVLCERESSCEEKPSRSARATAAPSSGWSAEVRPAEATSAACALEASSQKRSRWKG